MGIDGQFIRRPRTPPHCSLYSEKLYRFIYKWWCSVYPISVATLSLSLHELTKNSSSIGSRDKKCQSEYLHLTTKDEQWCSPFPVIIYCYWTACGSTVQITDHGDDTESHKWHLPMISLWDIHHTGPYAEWLLWTINKSQRDYITFIQWPYHTQPLGYRCKCTWRASVFDGRATLRFNWRVILDSILDSRAIYL